MLSCQVHWPPGRRSANPDGKHVIRKSVWANSMVRSYPLLTDVALRLLSMRATLCSAERNWTGWRYLCGDNRRRLLLEKVRLCTNSVLAMILTWLGAEKLVFIASMAAVTKTHTKIFTRRTSACFMRPQRANTSRTMTLHTLLSLRQ